MDTAEAKTISLLLVDDHPVVRKGTRDLLEGERDLHVVGEAESGEEAITQARALRPDVILMDVSMPGMNGIEATRHIKAEMPTIGVLVLTSYDDDAYVFALLEAGAAGYILKNATEDELLGAVRAVAAGESALHPSVARKVLERFSNHVAPTPAEELLSPRELEVLRIAATGRTNKEIARDLDISPRTVQVHLANIFSKLGVGSRTEAVLYGIKRGWIDVTTID
ncbi:response regulator [Deinococcus peraridilitoris]|uniref:Response regulator containing a CheY-like receiver domain and an HTH DNA-binding domain protein n=1 Tax=Deinococcus peraridilitoris (strain DSM 19664 / LMG 22246 / CIP 109416 / KR-200) TaxID=937777 RepID=L0A494_DEIPD|nr:response regulator transcription factor [Deinococcus peraridilitoris]AFZ68703.1 response regulator containing a CheY-like receiver domain and an HTH DNA-binding domain protein [Deinococcus peraridilitoris DSM 19664]